MYVAEQAIKKLAGQSFRVGDTLPDAVVRQVPARNLAAMVETGTLRQIHTDLSEEAPPYLSGERPRRRAQQAGRA